MQRIYKPGSVQTLPQEAEVLRLSFISTSSYPLALAIYPPTRASNPQALVYMILQPIRRTATYVTAHTGRLLPYLLTITSGSRLLLAVVLFYTTLASRLALR